MREGDTSIAVIAASLGFGSESAFSTAFKRNVGEPPQRFRHRSRRESDRSATHAAPNRVSSPFPRSRSDRAK
ncbi:AraC family transcriptional regulator [Streptomyces sp. NPDC094034]|uniref:helix-turn-helix domain-containing protein n=1 Tax=Streptomyces sp. NPDC094034 TaxID=3155309 RepID=UPI003320C1B0